MQRRDQLTSNSGVTGAVGLTLEKPSARFDLRFRLKGSACAAVNLDLLNSPRSISSPAQAAYTRVTKHVPVTSVGIVGNRYVRRERILIRHAVGTRRQLH